MKAGSKTRPPRLPLNAPEPLAGPDACGDRTLWQDPWGRIVGRADGTFYAQGRKNGLRVFAAAGTWHEIRRRYLEHRRRAYRKAGRHRGLLI